MATETALPRSIRRGPRITLTCKCGERNYLRYGERWTCGKCGRTWNTRKIPVEQYAEIRRTQLRYRRIPIMISVIALICVITFIVMGKAFGGLIVVAFGASAWSMFARPLHKKRFRRAIADLPSWEIEPE
ncbi:MAG: hypothetical protein ACR2JH_01840 [Solirubrobacteraceae bacterium]